jgi:hypothetical protein
VSKAIAIIANVIEASESTNTIVLKTGDAVSQNEVIVTDEMGIRRFELADETRLAIGAGATVVLDNFVYDSDSSGPTVAIHRTLGAMRLITGKSDHVAREIVTPRATVGVCGAVVDVFAKGDGEIAIALIEGAVDVCPTRGKRRVHHVVGKSLHTTSTGVFCLREKWNGTFPTHVVQGSVAISQR